MTILHEIPSPSPSISTTELRDRLGDQDLTVIDARPLTGYNGWRLGDEARGGHLPGAVAFPSAWLTSVDAPEIRRILEEKGIVPGREVVVYGAEGDDAGAVAGGLTELGIEN